ncbi:MAG: hypothetical protein WC438_03320 [Candidatus Pacearchaeota archaeon]
MSFGDINILERIGNVQNLAEAFNCLKGLEFIASNKGSSYQCLDSREEFVILTDVGQKNSQLLHPYGTNIFYSFREPVTPN